MRFRLIDAIVALLVCGLLAVLLLPIFNRSSEQGDSRRIFCANNLRQNALALVTLEDYKRGFPGYLNRTNDRAVSWVVPALRFLERQDLAESWSDRQTPRPKALFLSSLVCSADPAVQPIAPLSYVVNSGVPDSLMPGAAPADKLVNGVFHNRYDSPSGPTMTMAFLNAHDGAANTMLLTENVQAGQWAGNGQYDMLPGGEKVVAANGLFAPEQAERLTTFVWHPSQAQAATAVAERQINAGHTGKLDEAPTIDFARPSSFHRGGANVAMADSSVRFVSEKIDYGVYVALMTPDGANSDAPDVPIAGTTGQTWRTVDHAFLDERLSQ